MQNQLKRSLSVGDIVALGINGVVGTGIFLLPGVAAAKMGPASITTLVFAALLSFLIALCFAEVGSRFKGTGGAYLYALRTFGDAPGFFVGWMVLVVTIVSWAAMVNGLADAIARSYIPQLANGFARGAFILGFMALLTLINLRGAKKGAWVSNVFTIAKLVPLVLFVVVGLFYVDTANFTPFAPQGFGGNFFEATLIILYAFVGFEALVVPAGEMANPKRAVPLALLSVLILVFVIYVGVMVVAIGTLPELAGHKTPVIAASEKFMGSWGAQVIAAGIVISIVGVNAAQALVGPRRVFALAENGHMPRVLARVNKSGVPALALILLFVVGGGIAVFGSFKTLALVSVVGRFAQYISTCLAVVVLRKKHPDKDSDRFRLPLGPTIPILALGLCVWLLVAASLNDTKPIIAGGIALAAAVPVYSGIVGLRKMRKSEVG